ncbi:hypothetical protein [Microbacterium aerolatum]|uniref:hypothetical protein n=1 Tax=Microbacterium aerolatum TaxID=153731 RepID=UPI00384C7E45
MDPTLLAVLSIFGGAGLTTAAGFVGAGIQARREHSRWIRERRLDAYVRFLAVVQAFEAENIEATEIGEQIKALGEQNAQTHQRYQDSADPEERAALKAIGEGCNSELEILIKLSDRGSERVRKLRETLAEDSVPFGLLGPREVREAAFVVEQNHGDNSFGESVALLHDAMRKALRIKD